MKKGKLPLYFQVLNYSNHAQMPAFAELCKELGVKSSSVAYIDDLHGIEYQAQWQIFPPTAGVKILSNTPIPPGIKDVSSLVKQWQGENADVICSFQYPPENILTISTLMQLNYNPKAFLGGPGCSTQAIFDIWKGAADQIFFEGAWTYEQNARSQGLLRQALCLCWRPGERRLLGRADLQGRAGLLRAGHREGRHAGSGQGRRGHADRALQDAHERRHVLHQPDPGRLVLCRARSASGRTVSPRSSTRARSARTARSIPKQAWPAPGLIVSRSSHQLIAC